MTTVSHTPAAGGSPEAVQLGWLDAMRLKFRRKALLYTEKSAELTDDETLQRIIDTLPVDGKLVVKELAAKDDHGEIIDKIGVDKLNSLAQKLRFPAYLEGASWAAIGAAMGVEISKGAGTLLSSYFNMEPGMLRTVIAYAGSLAQGAGNIAAGVAGAYGGGKLGKGIIQSQERGFLEAISRLKNFNPDDGKRARLARSGSAGYSRLAVGLAFAVLTSANFKVAGDYIADWTGHKGAITQSIENDVRRDLPSDPSFIQQQSTLSDQRRQLAGKEALSSSLAGIRALDNRDAIADLEKQIKNTLAQIQKIESDKIAQYGYGSKLGTALWQTFHSWGSVSLFVGALVAQLRGMMAALRRAGDMMAYRRYEAARDAIIEIDSKAIEREAQMQRVQDDYKQKVHDAALVTIQAMSGISDSATLVVGIREALSLGTLSETLTRLQQLHDTAPDSIKGHIFDLMGTCKKNTEDALKAQRRAETRVESDKKMIAWQAYIATNTHVTPPELYANAVKHTWCQEKSAQLDDIRLNKPVADILAELSTTAQTRFATALGNGDFNAKDPLQINDFTIDGTTGKFLYKNHEIGYPLA